MSTPGARYGFYVDGVVRDTTCRFLIDTGSTDTLICSTVYYQIPKEQRPVLETNDVQVRQVDGSPLAVLGTAWVDVQIGRTKHPVKAVFTEMKCSGILGMDFLLPTGGNLDFQTQEWRLNGEKIRCSSSAEEPVSEEVKSEEKSQKQPQEEMSVRGVVAQPTIPVEAMRAAQLADKTMSWVIRAKEEDSSRPEWKTVSNLPAPNKTYWSQWDQLTVREGLLQRRWESDDGKSVRWQLVLPRPFRKEILNEVHAGQLSGHLGVRKTEAKVKYRYYWPGMSADTRSFLRSCDQCARRKSPAKKVKAPLQQYQVGVPVERVAIDLLGPLPESDSGNRWVMVVGDYCTKWMEAYPLPNAIASTVALKLVQEFICRFGVPQELHSDQGTNFESEVFGE